MQVPRPARRADPPAEGPADRRHLREASLARGETVIEPRVHLEPGVARGHFNVLRGAIGGTPLRRTVLVTHARA